MLLQSKEEDGLNFILKQIVSLQIADRRELNAVKDDLWAWLAAMDFKRA